MTFEVKGGYRLYRFDSFESYLDRASNPVFKLQHSGNESRWGTPVFDKMLHNARHGWSNHLDLISQWANMIVEDISTHLPKPEIDFDKTGSFWDLSRVIEGDPECWIHEDSPSKEIDRGGRGNIVRMVINTAASFDCFENSHRHRCGAVLALTQLLEKCGMYVQFEITTAIGVQHHRLEFRTVAKAAGEALNLAAVSFWSSKQMERHIDFAICETMAECRGGYFGTTDYGHVIGTSDRGDICFDGMTSDGVVNWNDAASVRRYVVQQLHRQGIKLQT